VDPVFSTTCVLTRRGVQGGDVGGKRHAIDFLVSTGAGGQAGQGGAQIQGSAAMVSMADNGDDMAKRARLGAGPGGM
jgi:hypothetical protein